MNSRKTTPRSAITGEISSRRKVERIGPDQHAHREIADDRRQPQPPEYGDHEHRESEQHQQLGQNGQALGRMLAHGRQSSVAAAAAQLRPRRVLVREARC